MSNIILFEEKHVRRAWNKAEEKWYFAIVDVIAVLTESPNPQVCWRVMKKRLRDEGNQTVTNCDALKMAAANWGTNCPLIRQSAIAESKSVTPRSCLPGVFTARRAQPVTHRHGFESRASCLAR